MVASNLSDAVFGGWVKEHVENQFLSIFMQSLKWAETLGTDFFFLLLCRDWRSQWRMCLLCIKSPWWYCSSHHNYKIKAKLDGEPSWTESKRKIFILKYPWQSGCFPWKDWTAGSTVQCTMTKDNSSVKDDLICPPSEIHCKLQRMRADLSEFLWCYSCLFMQKNSRNHQRCVNCRSLKAKLDNISQGRSMPPNHE